jgi:lipopolysaccharide/colanic/teichoic acid biosynthesis glycosyltransferase
MFVVATTWLACAFAVFRTSASISSEAGLVQASIQAFSFALWAGLSAILAFRALRYLGHFSSFHPLPERSGLFTLLFVPPLAAMLAKYLILLLTGAVVLRYRDALALGPIVATAAFTFEYVYGWWFIRSGNRRLVFTALSTVERHTLETTFDAKGLGTFYRFEDVSLLPSALAKSGDIHWIAISRSQVRDFLKSVPLIRAQHLGVPVIDYRRLNSVVLGRIDLSDYDSWAFLTQAMPVDFLHRIYREAKPFFESLLALLLLIGLFPLMLLVALAVRVTDGGPAFYRQGRTGYLGRPFLMIKFRSMRLDAEAQGPTWAQDEDPRVTAIGRFLRKSRIDELPQLWNVLIGEMSFVGPRPERPEISATLEKQIPLFSLRLLVRPGITGWSQVMQGYASSVEQSRRKLEYDLYHIQNMSPRLDAVIILKTILTVLRRKEFHREPARPASGRPLPAMPDFRQEASPVFPLLPQSLQANWIQVERPSPESLHPSSD